MTDTFIPEHEVYSLLSAAGIGTPRHCFIEDADKLSEAPFAPGDPVVVKGIARDLWHKSDVGALWFRDFDAADVAALHRRMRDEIGQRYDWLGTLVS